MAGTIGSITVIVVGVRAQSRVLSNVDGSSFNGGSFSILLNSGCCRSYLIL